MKALKLDRLTLISSVEQSRQTTIDFQLIDFQLGVISRVTALSAEESVEQLV